MHELVEADGRPRLDLWGHENQNRTGSPNVNEDALDIGQRLLKRHNAHGMHGFENNCVGVLVQMNLLVVPAQHSENLSQISNSTSE